MVIVCLYCWREYASEHQLLGFTNGEGAVGLRSVMWASPGHLVHSVEAHSSKLFLSSHFPNRCQLVFT